MEPALKILPDVSGEIAGRSLEECNAAYVKVENYFHALRIRNKPLLGQLVLRVLERAQRRAPVLTGNTARRRPRSSFSRTIAFSCGFRHSPACSASSASKWTRSPKSWTT